jgi:FMN phosphatase YigB (HAD superfamily)
MPEWNISQKQKKALDKIGYYEIKKQDEKYGTLSIQVGKYYFIIYNDGTVRETASDFKTPRFSYKGEKHKESQEKGGKPKYHLEKPQRDLLAKNGLTEADIDSQLGNKDIVVMLKGKKWVFGYDGLSMSKEEYDKKYGALSKKTETTTPTYTYSLTTTVCKERPEVCKPRQIEHVAWDADHTIWNLHSGIASSVSGRLEKLDDDTVVEYGKGYSYTGPSKKKGKGKKPTEPVPHVYEDIWTTLGEEYGADEEELAEIEESLVEGLTEKDKEFLAGLEGVTGTEQKLLALPPSTTPPEPAKSAEEYEVNRITLLPTFRQTLDELEKRGIKSSVISLNSPGTVKRILEAFGLAGKFIEIKDTWENKGKVFREITSKHKLCPCNSIFIDDTLGNVRDVAKECGMGLVIGKDKDVEKPFDIFQFILESK